MTELQELGTQTEDHSNFLPWHTVNSDDFQAPTHYSREESLKQVGRLRSSTIYDNDCVHLAICWLAGSSRFGKRPSALPKLQMSGSVAKRERKKPALYNPADFDGEAGEGKGKRKGKETKDKDKRGKTGDEAFDDLNVEPGSLLQRRISVNQAPFRPWPYRTNSKSPVISLSASLSELSHQFLSHK